MQQVLKVGSGFALLCCSLAASAFGGADLLQQATQLQQPAVAAAPVAGQSVTQQATTMVEQKATGMVKQEAGSVEQNLMGGAASGAAASTLAPNVPTGGGLSDIKSMIP